MLNAEKLSVLDILLKKRTQTNADVAFKVSFSYSFSIFCSVPHLFLSSQPEKSLDKNGVNLFSVLIRICKVNELQP